MKSPINILVTATTFPRKTNDTSPRFVHDLCASLAGHGVISPIVLVPHVANSLSYEEIKKVKIYRYKYFLVNMEKISGNGIVSNIQKNKLLALLVPFLIVFQFIKGLYLIKKHNVKAILANWIVPQGFVGVLLKIFNPGIKLIIVSHGGDAALLNKNMFLKGLARYILNRSDSVVAVSSFIKSKLLNTGFSSNEIHVISMGVDVERFQQVYKSHDLCKKDIDVLFVGRLEEKKGLKYLIESISILKNRYDINIKAAIVGDGSQKDILMGMVERLGLNSQIIFAGALEQEGVIKYFAESKMFVVPSVNLDSDVEGMPTVIFEAMSVGLPLITTDAGGITDVVVDNVNGFIVEQMNSEELAIKIRELLFDVEKQYFLSTLR